MVNSCLSTPEHPSIPEKVYKLLVWFTNPDARSALVLYGPTNSGKTVALWEAIEQLKRMTPEDRHIPKEITLYQEGLSFLIFKLSDHTDSVLGEKTILVVTADRLPQGMAQLLCADKMKFERE